MYPVMKTLLLSPPSFDNFDGGAGSRWPATREIESFWYPVWLSYPAGLLPGSRLLDAPSHKITAAETVRLAWEYEFVVLFTSTVGFASDLRLIRSMKAAKPDLKVAFVGPPAQVRPTETLMASEDIDFVVRGEFDDAVVEFAKGRASSADQRYQLSEQQSGNSQRFEAAAGHGGTGQAPLRHRRVQTRLGD